MMKRTIDQFNYKETANTSIGGNFYPVTSSISIKDENNDEELCTNVFSQLGKFEKNKQYQQLQKDLNLLKQNVELMEEFTNKDNFSSKRKSFSNRLNILSMDKDNKDNNNKKYYSRL